jgi:hypothetical protein
VEVHAIANVPELRNLRVQPLAAFRRHRSRSSRPSIGRCRRSKRSRVSLASPPKNKTQRARPASQFPPDGPPHICLIASNRNAASGWPDPTGFQVSHQFRGPIFCTGARPFTSCRNAYIIQSQRVSSRAPSPATIHALPLGLNSCGLPRRAARASRRAALRNRSSSPPPGGSGAGRPVE